jgi:nicotinate-nucleotide adenylyltransferase
LAAVGIYGGTFDPIHLGHLHVITQVLERKIVDHLLVVPAGQPLLRSDAPQASGPQRRAMCQLGIDSLPSHIRTRVEINPIEILREGPSYAIDTVDAVTATHPDSEIILFVGSDAYINIDKWHRVEELKKKCRIIVIQRPGYPLEGLDISALDISATQIREELSNQIPESVAHYIKENGLYASPK